MTSDTAEQTQKNSTNPCIVWAFGLTLPTPGYGQSDTEELHQPMDWLGVFPKPTYGNVEKVKLVLYDHI